MFNRKEYREKHKEEHKEYHRKYYSEHKDKYTNSMKKYRSTEKYKIMYKESRKRNKNVIKKCNYNFFHQTDGTDINSRQEYTGEEIELLLDKSISAPILAKKLKRSIYAIYTKRSKLYKGKGKIK